MTTPATMTVPELELLLHQETLRGLRDLSREASGRERRRLEGELRRQGDWVPHWLHGEPEGRIANLGACSLEGDCPPTQALGRPPKAPGIDEPNR